MRLCSITCANTVYYLRIVYVCMYAFCDTIFDTIYITLLSLIYGMYAIFGIGCNTLHMNSSNGLCYCLYYHINTIVMYKQHICICVTH